jgi:hypothetical protein
LPGRIERVAPLVDQAQKLCRRHLRGDGRAAGVEMLAFLRRLWSDIPEEVVPPEEADRRDAEELVLSIISDVGEVAAMLLRQSDAEQQLSWSRANLICDLERYLVVTRRGAAQF